MAFKVLAEVHASLDGLKSDANLIGYEDGSDTIIVSLAPASDQDTLLNSLLPAPLKVVGTVTSSTTTTNYSTADGRSIPPPTPLPPGENPLKQTHVLLRCAVDFTVEIPVSSGGTADDAVSTWEQALCGPDTVYLVNATELAGSTPMGAFSGSSNGQSWEQQQPLFFQPLCRPHSRSDFLTFGNLSAPSAAITPCHGEIQWSTVHLDVLCYAPAAMPAKEAVQKVLIPGIKAQLTVCRTELNRVRDTTTTTTAAADNNNNKRRLPPLCALHFLPPGFNHHITIVYPLSGASSFSSTFTSSIAATSDADEALLEKRRFELHAVLGLPSDRPLLRVANAVTIIPNSNNNNNNANRLSATTTTATTTTTTTTDESDSLSQSQQRSNKKNSSSTPPLSNQRLQNVHETLPPSGIKGGTQHLVRGNYDYYHYMQDKFDDCGWGCAYRSLQTLSSWFQRQLYTSRSPPTHKEIQSTLVGLGDKPAEFLGSKQWIGAIELGFVLDALLGVSCKVMTVASGAEMTQHARAIAAHFDTQETPIMIGGGVLAYTLLGIDYNADSGECAFLILDPHYTGVDDLNKIKSGQWVAWKRFGDKAAAGGDLFVPGAFYNLLCPQRPNTV